MLDYFGDRTFREFFLFWFPISDPAGYMHQLSVHVEDFCIVSYRCRSQEMNTYAWKEKATLVFHCFMLIVDAVADYGLTA